MQESLDLFAPNGIFLCDFDGTISLKDVTDTLIEQFGQPGCDELEAQWLAGDIGSQTCMRGQIALLDMSQAELDDCLQTVKIDSAFGEFLEKLAAHNIPVQIVSDGLDYAIATILKHNHLPEVPILANHLVNTGERSWRLEFPYANTMCKKRSGNCKCVQAAQLYNRYDQIFYVGDSTSDYCVSHNIDWVFAKDKLIKYCEEERIGHYPIAGFSDIVALMAKLEPQQCHYQNGHRSLV